MSTTMPPLSFLQSYAGSFSFAGGATRANVGGVRGNEHLSRALEEVDGLFAGMKYLDATDPLHTTARPNSVPDDDLALELEALCRAASSRQPTSPQSDQEIAWSSVRDVRDGMQCHWRHFVKVSHDLDMPIINRLRDKYKDAKGLREAGVFAFRNTLTSPSPNNLEEIFAFCSLSYVVSCLLHARGRFEKTEILAGITIWLNAIKIPEEREIFRDLARTLWPEARTHLHSFDMDISPLAQQSMATLRGGCYPQYPIAGLGPLPSSFAPSHTSTPLPSISGSSLQASGFQTAEFSPYGLPPANLFSEEKVEDLIRVTEATRGEMHFNTLDSLPFDPSTLISNSCDDTGTDHFTGTGGGQIPDTNSRQGHFPNTGQPQFPDASYSQDTDCSQFFGLNHGTFPGPSLSSIPTSNFPQQPATSGPLDILQILRDTGTFEAVLKYCRENGNFWYDLSGCGAISKDIGLLFKWTRARDGEEQRIYKQYLAQLVSEKDTKDAPSRGIVSVVEAFVKIGYLQNTSEVKDYMTRIAKALFHDAVAHNEFMAWILPQEGYPCPTCGRVFPRKWNMQRHCEDVHNQRVWTERGQQRRGRACNVRGTVALEG
ncbi:hypothetical protein LCI18_008772 [Fusarium solani-melongenae]|uniref:Uncharacterized protein n=1 Tax=Fusarium solani subsp. cucurbitae TaxID=2747967 RepID=A0ACD3Z9S0_FUSSC|nr:hypothetical protein LCI18_008772 [Fusarium solani-melongenae]